MIAIYDRQGQEISSRGVLDSLRIPVLPNMVISLVGGGGKTSLMLQLAKEGIERGLRVVVTTSTHIGVPKGYPVLLIRDSTEFAGIAWKYPTAVAGEMVGENKLKGITSEQIDQIRQYADLVLVESDGARQLPFKVPEQHEPVIYPGSAAVISCVGLDCLARKMTDKCFRLERACELLNKRPEDVIEEQDVARVLSSVKGSKKGVGSIPYRIVLNKADSDEGKKSGINILKQLDQEVGIITSFRREYEPLQ